MAELRCSDGTVVQISAETEAELRKAFGPEITYRIGDIFWRSHNDGQYLQLSVSDKGRVGLRRTTKIKCAVNGFKPVKDINAITMDEVRRMTIYSSGLRFVEVFTVSEE